MRVPFAFSLVLALPLAAACTDPADGTEAADLNALGEQRVLPLEAHIDPSPPDDHVVADEPFDLVVGDVPVGTQPDPVREPRAVWNDEPVLDAFSLGRRARARYDWLRATGVVHR